MTSCNGVMFVLSFPSGGGEGKLSHRLQASGLLDSKAFSIIYIMYIIFNIFIIIYYRYFTGFHIKEDQLQSIATQCMQVLLLLMAKTEMNL